jgi:hypothetical protein
VSSPPFPLVAAGIRAIGEYDVAARGGRDGETGQARAQLGREQEALRLGASAAAFVLSALGRLEEGIELLAQARE